MDSARAASLYSRLIRPNRSVLPHRLKKEPFPCPEVSMPASPNSA
jgi:hypothetical protein